MLIGDRINKIMLEKGLNFSSFSKLLDISDVQIRNIALNKSIPKVDLIQKLVSLYDIDVNWLITGEEKKTSINELGKDVILDYLLENRYEFLKLKKMEVIMDVFTNLDQKAKVDETNKNLEKIILELKKRKL